MAPTQLDLFAANPPPPFATIPENNFAEPLDEIPVPVVETISVDEENQIGLFGDSLPIPLTTVDDAPEQTIYVHFEDVADVATFGRFIGTPVTTQTRYLQFPIEAKFHTAWRARSESESDDDAEAIYANGEQSNIFGHGAWWEEYWRGMPEFDQKNLAPKHSIQVDFATRKDVDAFARLIDQTITPTGKRTRSVWYPEAEIGRFADKRYRARPPALLPKYPIFIPSRGRSESRHTVRHLEALGVPYTVVVEPAQFDAYARVIDPKKLLALPFDTDGRGGVAPARNWIWEYAEKLGVERHWQIDDNIDGFFRLNRNLKTPVADGTIFRVAEEFSDRYSNVAQSGFNYFMFASRKTKIPPLTLNTRVYSCMLLRNGLGYRFRGPLNDDTDLSLRILKDGWSTVLFNAFLAFKMTTMTVKGGIADTLYKDEDGRKKGSEQLRDWHPDVAKVVWKWGRWHHSVDYSRFRENRLTLRDGVEIGNGVDDFGMFLEVDNV